MLIPVPDPPDAIRTGGEEATLLVETEVMVRLSLSQYLRDCGFVVLEA